MGKLALEAVIQYHEFCLSRELDQLIAPHFRGVVKAAILIIWSRCSQENIVRYSSVQCSFSSSFPKFNWHWLMLVTVVTFCITTRCQGETFAFCVMMRHMAGTFGIIIDKLSVRIKAAHYYFRVLHNPLTHLLNPYEHQLNAQSCNAMSFSTLYLSQCLGLCQPTEQEI